jgi:hypothetical protein
VPGIPVHPLNLFGNYVSCFCFKLGYRARPQGLIAQKKKRNSPSGEKEWKEEAPALQ